MYCKRQKALLCYRTKWCFKAFYTRDSLFQYSQLVTCSNSISLCEIVLFIVSVPNYKPSKPSCPLSKVITRLSFCYATCIVLLSKMNIAEETLCVFINFRSGRVCVFFSTINLNRMFLTKILISSQPTGDVFVLKDGIHRFLILKKRTCSENV